MFTTLCENATGTFRLKSWRVGIAKPSFGVRCLLGCIGLSLQVYIYKGALGML